MVTKMQDGMSEELIMMPKTLTAENGAKGLLSGEFSETVTMECGERGGSGTMDDDGFDEACDSCTGSGVYELKVGVTWTTIKDIYAMYAEYQQNKLDNKRGD